ncbi:hypothetical protein Bbelb_006360 [Branchiostoma belcheri]|nr:hypothetical protein Bbelb_006360 [Branchiostoma belcheri]
MSDAGSTLASSPGAPASFLQTSHVTQASITTTPHAPLHTPAHPYGSYRCHPYDSGRQSLLSSLGFQAAGPADLPPLVKANTARPHVIPLHVHPASGQPRRPESRERISGDRRN